MLTLASPAKLNLFFRVLYKRQDGFHEIASLYQAIDLCDTLAISLSDSITLTCSDPHLPTDQTNLVLKAAHLFIQKTGCKERFSFHLEKRIPIQSGLGGGSGNAATTLWGLNHLLETNLDDKTLASWAAEIGSDPAFFFSYGRAFCEGRGEKLTLLPEREEKQLWIAKPQYGLSTPEVYRHLDLALLKPRADLYYNDLEISAFKLMPGLAQLREDLLHLGFEHVHMTGSGTAFFCMGDVSSPHLPNIHFYPVNYLYRSPGSWYKK